LVVVAVVRVIRARMVAKLAEVKQERNTALLKVIEKEGAIGRLCSIFREPTMTSRCCSFFRGPDRAGAISGVSEQDAAALSQVGDAQRKSEAISEKAIGDITQLGRVMRSAMAELRVSPGLMTPETLIEEVGRLPSVV
jgi:hypothetical protein